MSDPTFPVLHGRPPLGWLNDPNGVSRFGDRYHVFFQHNPDAPTHGDISWGHVSSTDLLHWEQQPVALRPRSDGVDAAGCWSGCVVDDDGVPTAIYTAVTEHASDGQATLARGSADLRDWVQGEPVMGNPDDPSITEVRDPYALTLDGHRYVVQGAGRPVVGGRPQLLGYRADDLTRWEPLGAVLTADDPIAARVAPGNIWECPNLFPLDGRWVLLLSLWLAAQDGQGELSGVRYLVGDLSTAAGGLTFVPRNGGVLDSGPAFYAPQALVDGGRVLLWGWAWELDRTPEQIAAAGWAGALTFPRELFLDGDQLAARPATELTGLRAGPLDAGGALTETAFELISASPLGLSLRVGGEEKVVVDPAVFSGGPARILVDGSLIEAYGSAGTYTTRAYPEPGSTWHATGTLTEAYRLAL